MFYSILCCVVSSYFNVRRESMSSRHSEVEVARCGEGRSETNEGRRYAELPIDAKEPALT